MQQKNTDIQVKDQLLQRKLGGESVASIAVDTGIPRSTIYSWIAAAREVREEEARKKGEIIAADPRTYFKQKEHIDKLEGMLEVLKAVFDVTEMPLDKRLKVLEEFYHQEKYSVRLMCEVLEVPRGTFYNYINRGLKGNTQAAKRREVMKAKIRDTYYDSNQIYGAAKIHAILKDQGERVTVEFVRELMREMDLQSIRIGSKKRHYDETRKCQNIVKRNFTAEHPNQIWVSDVTYYRFDEMQYFICVIMDLYARRVIAYKIGYSNNTHLVKETFRMAYESRKPEPGLIFHTDQGGNYRARAFGDYLKTREVTQSFSKPGVPYDNSVMETFFASMKREELYRYKYRSEREFRAAVDRYIDFYNTQRPHKTIHYKTPQAKEEAYAKTHKTEASNGAE